MAESTDMGPKMQCGGRQYVAGGPTILGMATPADEARGVTSYGSMSRAPSKPAEAGNGAWVALGAVAALTGLKWLVEKVRE